MQSQIEFLKQVQQFHSIEHAYFERHSNLFSTSFYTIQKENHELRQILEHNFQIYNTPFTLASLDLPTEYEERWSLEELWGFYNVTKALIKTMITQSIVGEFARRLYERYDAHASFLDGWLKWHLPRKI